MLYFSGYIASAPLQHIQLRIGSRFCPGHCATFVWIIKPRLTPPPTSMAEQLENVAPVPSSSAEQPVHNFLVESGLPLHDDDASVAKESLLKLISFIALAGQSRGEKRENSGWSDETGPAKIAKCRSLTHYSTGDDIPAYSLSG